MNRRQKIIVSVTGIFLVLLILVGITYGYFLTKISGNTNTKSISVSTANLQLVYGNGTSNLITSSDPIIPGKFSSTMDFTVTNNGNADTDYAVVLENFKVKYATTSGEQEEGVATSLAYPNDFKLKITCTSDLDGKTCSGLDDTLPTTNDILLTNSIEMGETQSYTLSLEYIETNTDQSNDMNKTIEGRINIIDPKTTVDIEGTLASYSTGDYVQVNSTPKVSQITSDGKYKVVGVEPGSHTIEIYSSNGTKKGTQSIEIVKGNTENVSGNTITITETSRIVTININDTYETTIDESIKAYNPYKEGTLAYNIYYNAMSGTNGTILKTIPETTPAEEISVYSFVTDDVTESISETSISIDTTYQSYYWTYGTGYTINEKTGKFTLTGVSTCKYNDGTCHETLIGKYIISANAEGNSNSTNTQVKTTNLSYIYKVTTSPESNSSTITMKAKRLLPIPYNTENILSLTSDDYGTSYYYRGNVTDNYVNFAGMCWRIVRIEGDGSTKLILEDKDTTCDSTSYTGDWSIGTGNYGYETSTESGVYKSNYQNPLTNNTSSMVKAFYNFQTTNLNQYTDKLKSGDWCLGDNTYIKNTSNSYTLLNDTSSYYSQKTAFYYDAYTRLSGNNKDGYKASLKCNGTKLNKFATVTNVSDESPMYVGAITVDEIVFAGGKIGNSNQKYYLINEEFKKGIEGKIGVEHFWTLSLYSFDGTVDIGVVLENDGYLNVNYVSNQARAFRPAIRLKANTTISSGDGTIEKPYVVE